MGMEKYAVVSARASFRSPADRFAVGLHVLTFMRVRSLYVLQVRELGAGSFGAALLVQDRRTGHKVSAVCLQPIATSMR